jgi:hypothetical protein
VIEVRAAATTCAAPRPHRSDARWCLPLALSTVLEDERGLFDFQLVQLGPAEVLLRTGLEGDAGPRRAEPRTRRCSRPFLARQGAAGVDDPMPRGRAGTPER